MKKLLAVVLLMLHLFNLAGYPVLFRYLIAQSTQQLTKDIDKNNFDTSELTELKIALNLPYIASYGDYQKHEGEITIRGNHYNYVKRKILNDTLYLLCLPNKQKNALQTAQRNYTKAVNNFGNNQKEDNTVKKMNILNQYYSFSQNEYSIITPQKITTPGVVHPASIPTHFFLDGDGKPPQIDSWLS